MTESHRVDDPAQADPAPKHLYLFREFMPHRGDREIVDPYGGPLNAYEAARDEMVEAIPSLIAFLKTLVVGQEIGFVLAAAFCLLVSRASMSTQCHAALNNSIPPSTAAIAGELARQQTTSS